MVILCKVSAARDCGVEFLIYLDVCCLNRPFDNQQQERIRLEAEAILLILDHCQSGEWKLIASEAIDSETLQIPDVDRRQEVNLLATLASLSVSMTKEVESRAVELVNEYQFATYDALHIACAEAGNADIFLTTDDRLLRKAIRYGNMLRIRVENPLRWLLEVASDGSASAKPGTN